MGENELKPRPGLPWCVLSNDGLGGGRVEEGTEVMMPLRSLPLVETPTTVALGGGSAVSLTNI